MSADPHPENAALLPVPETSLTYYFGGRLAQYAERLRPPPHEDTCWYVGSVLERFGRSEQLFAYEDGRLTLRPMAQLYGDAREARSERERCLLLQQLGDTALFLGALFPERYARRGIGRNYFIGMGGGAYGYLADNALRNRHVFGELARIFSAMLDVVKDSCARSEFQRDEDVLELYQRWLDTRDPALGTQLRALGITFADDERRH